MKQILSVLLFTQAAFTLQAQDFLGLSTGNYAGVTGVHMQPASIADSRYSFDLNLTSIDLGFRSNFVGLDRTFAVKNKFNFKGFNDYYDFRNKVLTNTPLTGATKGFTEINNTIQSPLSFMLTTSRKSAIALNMRSRTTFAMGGLNNQLANLLYSANANSSAYGSTIVADGLKVNGASWADIGVTYSRVLLDANKHFFKAGITGKYLAGISSVIMSFDQLSVTPNSQGVLAFNTGASAVQYARSETSFNVATAGFRNREASSFGGDIGLVYEFRGRVAKFKVAKETETGTLKIKKRRDVNKYSLKLGAALLDVGRLTFKSAPDAKNFTINKTLDLTNTGINNQATFDNYIKSNVAYTTANLAEYTLALPTTLSLQADLHLLKGFYVNGMWNKPFTMLNDNATYRSYTPEFYAVTPRWESRFIGLYVPVLLPKDRKMTIGTTLRVGPAFVGTTNITTLFKQTSINEGNIHAGVKLPFAYGKPSKAFKKLGEMRKKLAAADAAKVGEVADTNAALDLNLGSTDSDMQERLRMAEERATEAEQKIEELNAQKALDEASRAAAEAGKEVKEDTKKEITVDINKDEDAKKEGKKEDKKVIKKIMTKQMDVENGTQPVRIIINNYNAPAPAKDGAEKEEDIQEQIEMLRKKIELKEKMLNELKDGDQGCIELKKKFIA
jgi:hypothetical protein